MNLDFKLEQFMRLYHSDGWFFEIRPDPEGCEAVLVTSHDDENDKNPKRLLFVDPEAAKKLAEAIVTVAEMIEREKT